jgi:hypothetical protein
VKGVEAYLDKNVLVFDRELLANLFAEADFRKEGSLDARALKAALSGSFRPGDLALHASLLMFGV